MWLAPRPAACSQTSRTGLCIIAPLGALVGTRPVKRNIAATSKPEIGRRADTMELCILLRSGASPPQISQQMFAHGHKHLLKAAAHTHCEREGGHAQVHAKGLDRKRAPHNGPTH